MSDSRAKVVVISGGSLTGKSTLARALLEQLGPSWLLLEGDAHAPTMSGEWSPAALGRYAIDLQHSAVGWAARRHDVILDGFLPYPEDDLFDQCLAVLAPLDPLYVGVSAPEATLRARAAQRAGANLEWALRQSRDINARVPTAIDVGNANVDEQTAAIQRIVQMLAIRWPRGD